MTKCEFFRENERITGFSVSGHSGYAEAGQDILCASITAAVTLTLPVSCDEEDTVQAVLAGMMVYLTDLRDQYPDYIEVLEV